MGSTMSTPPPTRELINIKEQCEKMLEKLDMEPIRFNRAKDKERSDQDEAMDDFERQQRLVNSFLKGMREAKMDEKDGKLSLGTFGADAESNGLDDRASQQKAIKKGSNANQRFTDLATKFEKGILELEAILATNRRRFESEPDKMQEESSLTSDISFEQTLLIREKTIDLLKEQYHTVKEFGARKVGARGAKLVEKASSYSMQVDNLGQLPDLDPESWVHYRKYLEKDKEIDEALVVLYEKNLILKERAMAVGDHQRKVTPLEQKLQEDVNAVTTKAEEARDKMSALNEAIDGKGPGKICVYIMIVLGICGIGYLLYCEGGGDSC